MEIHRSLGVTRLVALMAGNRRQRAHDRLLANLDRLVDEARLLCARAEEGSPHQAGDPDAAVANAFRTVLAAQTVDWLTRAERTVATVRPSNDTLCGERSGRLRRFIDVANVALLKPADSRDAWQAFYRSVRQDQYSRSQARAYDPPN